MSMLLWPLFPQLRSKKGNKHQHNTKSDSPEVLHDSTYIILYFLHILYFWYNKIRPLWSKRWSSHNEFVSHLLCLHSGAVYTIICQVWSQSNELCFPKTHWHVMCDFKCISITSYEHNDTSNYHKFDQLFNSFFRPTTKGTSKLHITGPLWRLSTRGKTCYQ